MLPAEAFHLEAVRSPPTKTIQVHARLSIGATVQYTDTYTTKGYGGHDAAQVEAAALAVTRLWDLAYSDIRDSVEKIGQAVSQLDNVGAAKEVAHLLRLLDRSRIVDPVITRTFKP